MSRTPKTPSWTPGQLALAHLCLCTQQDLWRLQRNLERALSTKLPELGDTLEGLVGGIDGAVTIDHAKSLLNQVHQNR